MTALTVVSSAPTLDELAATVRREHAAAIEAGRSMVEYAIRAGDALRAAKEQVERGRWQAWLEEQFPEMHPKTPRLYMRLSKYQARVRAEQPRTIKDAQRMLLGESVRPAEAETREEAKRLVAGGMSKRAAAQELGVTYEAVLLWLNPQRVEQRRQRRRAEARSSRRARMRDERAAEVARVGGSVAEAYSLIRKAAQALEHAAAETEGEARQAVRAAQGRLYSVEDHIVKAVRLV